MGNHHKHLCATRRSYADIWDKKYGIEDPKIIPNSHRLDLLQVTQVKEIKNRVRVRKFKELKIKERESIKWAYGVTTVPERANDLLPKTLKSLSNGGFPSPRLFIDSTCPEDLEMYKKFGLPITTRQPTIRTFGNWLLGIIELYIREPDADRYVMFQDDLITYKNLRQYLEKCEYPEKGYWNLYTFPSNQKLAPDSTGWYESNQLGRGAVALIFSREALLQLVSSRKMLDRPQNPQRGHKAVDGGIVNSYRNIEGWKEYVHNPSLVQHTGLHSTMRNKRHQLAESFKGENFDALDLLPKEETEEKGLGDHIESALTAMGITSERVEEWTGKPCNCTERREKLNLLGAWAIKVLLGKTEDAKQHLDEMMEDKQ